jgi:hypothetical protein
MVRQRRGRSQGRKSARRSGRHPLKLTRSHPSARRRARLAFRKSLDERASDPKSHTSPVDHNPRVARSGRALPGSVALDANLTRHRPPVSWSCLRTGRDGRLRSAQIAHLTSRGRSERGAPTQRNSACRVASVPCRAGVGCSVPSSSIAECVRSNAESFLLGQLLGSTAAGNGTASTRGSRRQGCQEPSWGSLFGGGVYVDAEDRVAVVAGRVGSVGRVGVAATRSL